MTNPSNEAKHSQLTWRTDEEVDHEAILDFVGIMVCDCCIIRPKKKDDGNEINKANAKLIVNAVNTYYQREAALRAALQAIEYRDLLDPSKVVLFGSKREKLIKELKSALGK